MSRRAAQRPPADGYALTRETLRLAPISMRRPFGGLGASSALAASAWSRPTARCTGVVKSGRSGVAAGVARPTTAASLMGFTDGSSVMVTEPAEEEPAGRVDDR